MLNQNLDLLPRTILQAIAGMPLKFNPDEAKDLSATIQFNVLPSTTSAALSTGSLTTGGDLYLSIANGKCDFFAGRTPDPTLTITTPADVWLKIARKEMSGTIALLTGKYKARGEISLLMKMDKLFSRQLRQEVLVETS